MLAVHQLLPEFQPPHCVRKTSSAEAAEMRIPAAPEAKPTAALLALAVRGRCDIFPPERAAAFGNAAHGKQWQKEPADVPGIALEAQNEAE